MIQNSIFDDFENFGFLSKIWFFGILGGSWKFQVFRFLVDFVFFDLFGFLGGLKILAGGYGAVLVGVSIPPTQPCKEEARRPLLGSIFDPKFNF